MFGWSVSSLGSKKERESVLPIFVNNGLVLCVFWSRPKDSVCLNEYHTWRCITNKKKYINKTNVSQISIENCNEMRKWMEKKEQEKKRNRKKYMKIRNQSFLDNCMTNENADRKLVWIVTQSYCERITLKSILKELQWNAMEFICCLKWHIHTLSIVNMQRIKMLHEMKWIQRIGCIFSHTFCFFIL